MSVRGGLPDAPYAWDVAIRNLWAWGSVPSQNQLERIPRALRALVGLAFAAWLMFENVNRFSQRSPGLVTLSIATAAAVIATIVYLFVFPRHSSPGRRLAIVGLLGAIAIASMILLGNANPGQVAAFVTVITATELFTVDAVPGVRAALTELRDRSLAGIGRRLTLTGLLTASVLPEVLRERPAAVGPYLIIRDHFVQRLYHQHSGYWQPDGQGLEPVDAGDRAAALDLLAGGRPEPFASAARTLLAQRDGPFALEIITAGLGSHPESRELAELRQRALYRLMERHQLQGSPRFHVYAEMAGVEIGPVAP